MNPEQVIAALRFDALYRVALDVERQARLNVEMTEWEAATLEDGLDAEVPASRP